MAIRNNEDNMTPQTSPPAKQDLIDQLADLVPGEPGFDLRHRRDKVAIATQASYDALFDPQLAGISLPERLLVARYACQLSRAHTLVEHYRARLNLVTLETDRSKDHVGLKDAATLDAATLDAATLDAGALNTATIEKVVANNLDALDDPRLRAMLVFTRTLIMKPIEGDKGALLLLTAAGLSTPAVVTLAQLVAFLSYQIRLVASLAALKAAQQTRLGGARS
jgi:CMD domain protein